MALTPGSRLGPYEVVAKIGEGGMGEVYRARDSKLKRDVAIKALPASVAADAARLARFRREAEVLASLNHPNIAQIYGLEDADGHTALVLELVEGPTLADRIAQGAIPANEALHIAGQIADALEAAHEQGIVHRDLKPANIKVRDDGTVKVLDFGLAKAMDPASGPDASGVPPFGAAPSMSAATTSPAMTQLGMILGTAAYMAPEQASGKRVDKRADIWAFGVVLWEMLAGRRMFEGETISHVLAAVLTQEPDLAAVPVRMRQLLRRCLEKQPRKRLRDIGDAMSLVRGPEDTEAELAGTRRRAWLIALGWTLSGLLVGVVAVLALRPSTIARMESPLVRFQIERAADIYNTTATAFAVSPDGRMLAYYGPERNGQFILVVRTLATNEIREVPGSTVFSPRGSSLFWSPDSRQLVNVVATTARVFDVATGATRPLCECRFLGGTWNPDGVILLGAGGNVAEGIRRVSPGGRTLVAVTTVNAARGESDRFPVFLPSGQRFLFTRLTPGEGISTFVGTLDGSPPQRIMDGSQRIFVPASGDRRAQLLGIDDTGLVSRNVDPDTMTVTGAATTLVAGALAASASDNGVLVTSAAGSRPRMIPAWFDRKGTSLGTVGDPQNPESVALSRDGRRLAISTGPSGEGVDIWVRDLASGSSTQLTFNHGTTAVWSPDGTRIAFTVRRGNLEVPYERAADGTGNEHPLFEWNRPSWVNDWSSDGRWVIYSTLKPESTTDTDVWAVPMHPGSSRKPAPYLVADGRQQQAQFSPDGRFVAYGSDQAGSWDIYVQPFPNAADGKWMVSRGGGVEPRWSRDGKELFYFSGQTLMAVPVSVQPTFSHGVPVPLFDAPVQSGYTNDSHRWLVAPDGKRFLLLINAGKDQAPPLDVIVNWPSLLKR